MGLAASVVQTFAKTDGEEGAGMAVMEMNAFVFGFIVAGYLFVLWWNIEWKRIIKFWMWSGPPYRRSVEILFRTFFALCLAAGAFDLWRRVQEKARPSRFYRDAGIFAAVCLAVMVFMLVSVERVDRWRKRRVRS